MSAGSGFMGTFDGVGAGFGFISQESLGVNSAYNSGGGLKKGSAWFPSIKCRSSASSSC